MNKDIGVVSEIKKIKKELDLLWRDHSMWVGRLYLLNNRINRLKEKKK